MTEIERKLLDNALDGLDRLFDRESEVIDIYALIYATASAFFGTEYFPILNDTAYNLEKLIRSRSNANDEREKALIDTNDLRVYLAKILES